MQARFVKEIFPGLRERRAQLPANPKRLSRSAVADNDRPNTSADLLYRGALGRERSAVVGWKREGAQERSQSRLLVQGDAVWVLPEILGEQSYAAFSAT